MINWLKKIFYFGIPNDVTVEKHPTMMVSCLTIRFKSTNTMQWTMELPKEGPHDGKTIWAGFYEWYFDSPASPSFLMISSNSEVLILRSDIVRFSVEKESRNVSGKQ